MALAIVQRMHFSVVFPQKEPPKPLVFGKAISFIVLLQDPEVFRLTRQIEELLGAGSPEGEALSWVKIGEDFEIFCWEKNFENAGSVCSIRIYVCIYIYIRMEVTG